MGAPVKLVSYNGLAAAHGGYARAAALNGLTIFPYLLRMIF